MKKIISSFETKKKSLSLQKEKELMGIVTEEIKKIKEISPDFLKINQLKTEIQQLESVDNATSQKELVQKKKALKILEDKDIYQIHQELTERLDPQQIEQREKRKPTSVEKKEWEKIQKTYQKIKRAIVLLLHYNYSFIKYIERGYYHSGKIDHEDLTTEGIISLLKAVEKFDPSYGRRLSTFSGHRVRQRIKTFINSNQLISQSLSSKKEEQGPKLVYYDKNYQSDKESNAYSLMETLGDSQFSGTDTEKVLQQEAKRQVNELLNSLDSREVNLVIRWMYQIVPVNLFDIYCLTTEAEKSELQREMKISNKVKPSSLRKYFLHQKKVSRPEVVQKYLAIFSRPHEVSEIIRFLNLSKEEEITHLKSRGFKQLKKMAQARNLHLLI